MLNKSNFFLTTGEFAKLCNTTKDTLRHYQELGIIIPQKDETNGYYLYSLEQATSYYFISLFRQLDTSLKDIKTCLTDFDEKSYYSFCRKQLNSLVKMRSDLDRKILSLCNATMLIHHMKSIPDGIPHTFTFTEKSSYYFTPIKSTPSNHSQDIVTDIEQHVTYCNSRPEINTFPISATISYEDFCNKNYSYKYLCSSLVSKLNHKNIGQMPSSKVIGCSCNNNSNILEAYQNLYDYIINNKITVVSDLFSINLFNFIDTTEEYRYLKYIFFCIE